MNNVKEEKLYSIIVPVLDITDSLIELSNRIDSVMKKNACINLLWMTGSITGRRGQGCSQDRMPDQQMTTLLGPVLL